MMPMNKQAVLFHLKEAKEELDRTIKELEKDPRFREAQLLVQMGHMYHHLNTAWNGRKASTARHNKSAQIDFDMWRKFPTNKEMMLD